MTTIGRPTHEWVPRVVPRWEWRTFGHLEDVGEALAPLREGRLHESDETYVLSLHADGSVKVRDDLMDTKTQQHVDAGGLQLWVPTMKAAFPLDAAAVATMFDALGTPVPSLERVDYAREQLEDELLGSIPGVRVVRVRKQRRRSTLDGCLVELTDLTVGSSTTRTVAIESEDPALVTETVRRLGLAGRRNTCVAQGLKALIGWAPDRFAVIDVGTNSVKFHLAQRREGQLDSVVDRSVVTRLGEGLAQAGRLADAAMARTVDAVAGMADEARRDGPVDIVSVGTAGLRQASNPDAFVDAVFVRCGVTVEVVSGQEEARLAYLAAVSSLPHLGHRLVAYDSGGGSTQFTFGTPDLPEEQFSVDLGAVRITERYGLDGAVGEDTIAAALEGIGSELGRLEGRERPDAVVGMGGTSTNLAAVMHGLAEYDPDVVHGSVLTLTEVDRQIQVYRERTADQRREIAGLQPARAEVILAGACIVRAILTLTGQDAVVVSDRGLRHGVLAERFGSYGASSAEAK
jgi:exopolyphosphatase/guanosine-5'-triphosphate,3'-diphosphate pyrophosphatase